MAKTLESSIADRLNRMSYVIPTDREAFINYLTILTGAEIASDHDILIAAVEQAATELLLVEDARTRKVLNHLASEKKICAQIKSRQRQVA